jgi:hypothetical protein
MLTDDPGTPGAGNWEINTALLEEQTADTRARSFPHVDINYGLGEHIQLKYETGYLLENTRGSGDVQTGIDDSLLGVKWRFLDQQRFGVDASLYPQLELQNSRSAVNRGIAERGPNLLLPVEVSHDFGRIAVVGELGYQYLDAAKNDWVAGILGAFEVTRTLELLAEAHSVGESFMNRGDVIGNVGLRQQLGSQIKLLASAGTGLRGPDTTHFVAYLGFQWFSGQQQ